VAERLLGDHFALMDGGSDSGATVRVEGDGMELPGRANLERALSANQLALFARITMTCTVVRNP